MLLTYPKFSTGNTHNKVFQYRYTQDEDPLSIILILADIIHNSSLLLVYNYKKYNERVRSNIWTIIRLNLNFYNLLYFIGYTLVAIFIINVRLLRLLLLFYRLYKEKTTLANWLVLYNAKTFNPDHRLYYINGQWRTNPNIKAWVHVLQTKYPHLEKDKLLALAAKTYKYIDKDDFYKKDEYNLLCERVLTQHHLKGDLWVRHDTFSLFTDPNLKTFITNHKAAVEHNFYEKEPFIREFFYKNKTSCALLDNITPTTTVISKHSECLPQLIAHIPTDRVNELHPHIQMLQTKWTNDLTTLRIYLYEVDIKPNELDSIELSRTLLDFKFRSSQHPELWLNM